MKTKKYKRPSWDQYFIEVMDSISKRSTCDRGRSGCVIVRNNQIISAGYVGSAAGDSHCDDNGHKMQKRLNFDGSVSKHCIRTIHAEQNAICQAAKNGNSINGATLYCRMTPCSVCAKMIINSGIKRVVAQRKYHDSKESMRLFRKCKVKIEHIENKVQKY